MQKEMTAIEKVQNARPLNDPNRLELPVLVLGEIHALKMANRILGDKLYNKLTRVYMAKDFGLKISYDSGLLTQDEEELIVEFKEEIERIEKERIEKDELNHMMRIYIETKDIRKKAKALYIDNEKEQEKERKMKAAVRAGSDIEAIMDTMSDWDNARLATIKKRHALWNLQREILNKVILQVEGGDVFVTRKKGYVLTEEENAIVENFNEEINSRLKKSEALEEFLRRMTFEDEYDAKFGEEAKDARIMHENMQENSEEWLVKLSKNMAVRNHELLK